MNLKLREYSDGCTTLNRKDSMPEKLKEFLSNVSRNDATLLWDYLDSNPNAVNEMIELVAPLTQIDETSEE